MDSPPPFPTFSSSSLVSYSHDTSIPSFSDKNGTFSTSFYLPSSFKSFTTSSSIYSLPSYQPVPIKWLTSSNHTPTKSHTKPFSVTASWLLFAFSSHLTSPHTIPTPISSLPSFPFTFSLIYSILWIIDLLLTLTTTSSLETTRSLLSLSSPTLPKTTHSPFISLPICQKNVNMNSLTPKSSISSSNS